MVWHSYLDLRKEVTCEIKIAEKQFFADQILKYPNNTNNFWKMIMQNTHLTARMKKLLKKSWTSCLSLLPRLL